MINFKVLKTNLVALGVSLLACFAFSLPATAQGFDPLGQSCTEFILDEQGKKVPNPAADSPSCKQKKEQLTKKTNPVVTTIKTAANILALVAAIAAAITIVYSGYVFVTAGGSIGGQRSGDNPTRARQARSTLTGSVIGLIIVALAWSITTFIINRLL